MTRSLAAGAALVLAGCAASSSQAGLEEPYEGICGPAAAMVPGRGGRESREHPPACALPTAEELARTCATYDAVRMPGHRSPQEDENGDWVASDPLPEYLVDQASCSFTGSRRNRARCTFLLERPGLDAQPVPVRASLTHVFHEDHGPAHHMYWTFWQVDAACQPASQLPQ